MSLFEEERVELMHKYVPLATEKAGKCWSIVVVVAWVGCIAWQSEISGANRNNLAKTLLGIICDFCFQFIYMKFLG